MNITFDKALKQMVFNALRPSVKNRNCPFCDEPVRAKNFAGAFHYHDEPRFLHRSITCLIAYAGYLNDQEDGTDGTK